MKKSFQTHPGILKNYSAFRPEKIIHFGFENIHLCDALMIQNARWDKSSHLKTLNNYYLKVSHLVLLRTHLEKQ